MVNFSMLDTMNTVVRCMLNVFILFFKMVQGVEEHRAAVITLHHVGKKSGEIFKTLQGLCISHIFVYQTLAWCRETGSMKDQPHSGHLRDIHTQKRIHAAHEHIRKNTLCQQKVMSWDMKISPRTTSRILKDDLHLGAYKRPTGHLLAKKF